MIPTNIDNLAREAKHCRKAQGELLKAIEPLLVRRILAVRMRESDREDALQEARIAVIELAKSWQPDGGASFTSYCYSWIPHKVERPLRSSYDHVVSRPKGGPGKVANLFTVLEPARERESDDDGHWMDSITYSERQQEREAEREQFWCIVSNALPRISAIIVWRWACGSTTIELAAIAGVSHQAVAARLRRCLDRLRPLLVDWI